MIIFDMDGMKKLEHAVLLCTKNHVLIMSRLSQMKLIDVLQTGPFLDHFYL